MRTFLAMAFLFYLISCKTKITEPQITFSYKSTGMLPSDNKSMNQRNAETYLELRRGMKGISEKEREEAGCYWQRKFEQIKTKLTPAELIAVREYEKKLKADENFPYRVYTDSGTFSLSAKTISKLLEHADTVGCP